MSDLVANLALGLDVALSARNIGYCFLGALIGTLIGVLPGVGPIATMAMLLPLTYHLDPASALIMLAGIYYGAQYGGSTTAILMKLPGEASSVVTCIDGYAMARAGRAGAALTTAALASFAGGTLATLIIAGVSPPLTAFAQKFGPAEYFALMVFGLVASIIFANASLLRSGAMIMLGLLLGLVGADVNTAVDRFTFGFDELRDGLGFAAVSMGLFGVAEIAVNLERRRAQETPPARVTRLWLSPGELRAAGPAALRGTLLGAALGVLPGGSAMLASFASYALERRTARDPSRFGRGAVEGIAGPEAANNAAAQASFIPMLALGIPGNSVMAMMAGAMLIHGIAPSPNLATAKPGLFWGLIASMWIGNVILLVINLPLIRIWVKLLDVPSRVLFPAILMFCCVGIFSVNNSTFDIYLIALFGVLGYVFAKLDCPLAPFMLALILGPMMEENLRRAMMLAQGDATVFVARPLSLALLCAAALLAVLVTVPRFARIRRQAAEN